MTNPETENIRAKTGLIIFLILLLTFICYFNSFRNPFLWDDEVIVEGNQLIRSWGHLPDIFKASVFGAPIHSIGYYRPLQIFSYLVDYSLWQLNPIGYHLSNVILHLLNVFLVFLLLTALGVRRDVAYLVCLIFGIHPVNTEAVTYISGRGDVLFTFFSLLCFLFFIFGIRHSSGGFKEKIYYFFSIIFYLLALFSKENAVVLPFIMTAFVFLRAEFFKSLSTDQRKSYLLCLAVLLLLSFGYLFIRFIFLKKATSAPLSLIADAPFWQRVLTLPRILLTYIGLIIFPIHLHMEYLFVENSLTGPWFLLGLPALFGIFYFILRSFRSFKTALFFMAWFLIGLAPFYNVIVPLHATLLEHWVYFPSIGFLTLAVWLILDFLRKKKVQAKPILRNSIVVFLFCLLIYYGIYTILRNQDWSDPLRLYEHDLKYEPNSFLLYNNLGVEYFRQGKMEKAKDAFLASIEVSPRHHYDVAYNNAGVIYESEGQIEKAKSYYQKSIDLNNYELAYGNLGRLYIAENQLDLAIDVLKKGRALYPSAIEINYQLARAYFGRKQFTHARLILENIEKVAPDYKETRIYLEKIKNFKSDKL